MLMKRRAKMKELYRVDQLPVFQNKMYLSVEEALACPKADVVLVQDAKTGLIFNSLFDPVLMRYDSSYQNEQAHSQIFVKHLQEVSQIIKRNCEGYDLVEIGCGKGYFLEFLKSLGFQIIGFDPTYEGRNPAIRKEYFGPGNSVNAEGIILRHVLEHIANPVDFLFQIKNHSHEAKIYIEVPCFDWICHNRAWFDIFYEHVNYFRLADFYRIFGNIYESGHLFGGQYLYVLADLNSLREPRFEDEFVKLPSDFKNSLYSTARRIKESSSELLSVIWGGASKGVIFSLLLNRMGARINHVIDINPLKQGKYLGGTGLRVSSPSEVLNFLPEGSAIFIMNSNYADEIISYAGDHYHYWRTDNDI